MNKTLTPLFFERLGRVGAMLFLSAIWAQNSNMSIWYGLAIILFCMTAKPIALWYSGAPKAARNELIRYGVCFAVIILIALF